MMTAEDLVAHCERLYADTSLGSVHDWKSRNKGRPAFGHLPVYTPREVVHAAGALPVGVFGAGEHVDIVKGDACFQSYICHIPRSTVELGLTGDLDVLDGMLFPSTCDVIRNLSGIWQILFPKKPVRFVDLPQNFTRRLGGDFYKHDLQELMQLVANTGGKMPTKEDLAASIRLYNENRRAIQALYDLRSEQPQLVASDECFLVVKAGHLLEVSAHTQLVHDFIAQAKTRKKKKEDRIRVVMIGAFCEQPPLGLLRSLDRSGCYVVDDDLNLGMRWLEKDVDPGTDPLEAFAMAYLTQSTWASTKYEADDHRAPKLLDLVARRKADGVVFAAPSFCDPALLDQPVFMKVLGVKGIPHISFKYAENTGQFQGIREQAGTFSDSIKLWGNA